jgi:beta-glucosidase
MTDRSLDALLDAMSLDEQVQLLSGADFWTTAPIPRLGVPAVKVSDGPNGARGGIFKDGPSTACFPVGIALGATWNPALVQEAGGALGEEAKLKGARVLLAPTVNLHRTALNGRNFECYSEDPWLTGSIGVGYIRGVQSQGVAATIKHFVGNESEFQRMSMSSDIPERALRELYLLPFERAVKEAGVMAVMTAYNRLDGTFAADHRRLVTEVLRDEWGFDGLVMTDWMAEHDTVQGVLAGTDLEMPGPSRERGEKLVAAVREGRLDATAVRACALRVLQLAKRLGRFEDPAIPAERSDDLPATRALIRRLGSEGAVLLKNGPVSAGTALLPLAPQTGQTVALIGRAATVAQIMGGGSANVNAHYRVAPADALRAACPGVAFTHHLGADLHRWIPVIPAPMTLDFWANNAFEGAVAATQTSPSSEVMWFGSLPEGLDPYNFSARTTLRYVADADGEHAFSLTSTGLARATLNGEPVLDAWTHWQRGDTYFTFGCDEVVHRRQLKAGEVIEIQAEFSTAIAGGGFGVHALRVGAARVLGEADIAAAVEAARVADVAVVFAGLNAEWDNEGLDRPGIELPHHQNELIARVAAANPRTVVVLQTGSPVTLPWLEAVPAVLQAWYPGQECGNAIADVLLGAAEPGGRLPQTWPMALADTVGQGDPAQYPGLDGHVAYGEGVFIGYRHYQRQGITPRFPFGHGLSYTRFEFGPLRLSTSELQPGGTLDVEVDVRNLGERTGQAVVQLYVGAPEASVPRPVLELKAFAKLFLAPGETTTATLPLDMRSFAYFDEHRAAWIAEAGRYTVQVGRSVADLPLVAEITLSRDWVQSVRG